jgi:hypothetical protein
MSPLWNKRASESTQAYAAFCLYRDLGLERSLNAAYRSTQRQRPNRPAPAAPGAWTEWSGKYAWVERAAAYDAYLEEQRRAVRERKLLQLEERQADYQFVNQDRLERRIERMEKILDHADETPVQDVTTQSMDESGNVSGTIRTRGLNMSAYARLAREACELAKQAVNGVRPVAEKDSGEEDANHVRRGAKLRWTSTGK